jgi:hypothetical protein
MVNSNSSLFLGSKVVFFVLDFNYQNILLMYTAKENTDSVFLFRIIKKKRKREKQKKRNGKIDKK